VVVTATASAAPASAKYWRNAHNRRNWCSAVRWGHSWIERHPHWQKVCAPIEKFRPVGWWSNMCHTIYSAGSWGRWYRSNPWWRRQCKRIRNPQYEKGGAVWRWNPKAQATPVRVVVREERSQNAPPQ